MPSQKTQRAVTYTGCWTCKSRKVRCDERPIACKNCEKRGITCSGYGIRLHWISDSVANADSSPVLQGRRRIQLGRDFEVYDAETIERFLLNIDQQVDHGLPSCQGPFSAFTTTRAKSDQVVTPTSRGLTPQAALATKAHLSTVINPPQPEDTVLYEEGLQKDDSDLAPSSALWLPSNLATSPSSSSPTDIDELFNINAIGDSSPNEDEPEASLIAGHDDIGIGEKDDPALETSLVPRGGNNIIVRQLDHVLSGNRQQDYLIKHYYTHVAAVLLPLNHFDNPFRSLYLPTAMEGLFCHNANTTTSRETACTALYQSLLASASYHRWQCNKQDIAYHELGTKYRTSSIQLLQVALTQAPPTANYQALMLAVLSLVTIGVLSGECDDFRMHIQAATQLRSLRSQWRLLSRSSRRLNELGAFLALLSETTSSDPSLSSWDDKDDRAISECSILHSSDCYAFTYGITPTITLAINEICRLSKNLTRFQLESERLPEEFLEACEDLGSILEAWRLENEDITAIFTGDGISSSLFSHYAKGWHGAALIYYYTRIQGIKRADLTRVVDDVGEHVNKAEDLKSAMDDTGQVISMAPITWPAFIASCNAIRGRRGVWEQWWERVLMYKLGNMSKQWDLVQQIWVILDGAEDQGIWLSWTDAYSMAGVDVLLV
ncbi:hypothetical protein BFJ66_g9975 [Fusarium oxysporum f. sp. cepae]|uniref:Zn(2)-C6 fungal-type domain-containing protein n=1 Tax=Fusarium oxysporum f. sp. cepae TaxID=396571 RepID=A0A3L6NRM4_FUSOX|nr:hypothetical protein BFJ65_g4440 [Fusarium oxysporum f. sp. cepae]RKK35211.1 hypothetical protein BFJ67_g13375 [Fusarium oxysporum f. sp. cepae]RKK43524.1 hypothetical protein BFJ66_g9975 [Fusarium oxysporum f. sp. cepae]